MRIATTLRYIDHAKGTPWDRRYWSSNDYTLMAERYRIGLLAVVSEYDIEDALRTCDGLLIQGSSNAIDPKYYGGAPLERPLAVDEYHLDSLLIRHFFEGGKPIFGICGGEQELNIYFGGTIAKVPGLDAHFNKETHSHPINIVKGSFVYDVFGAERYTVNSHHAWWTDKVAPDFEVVATTDDGIVEALEYKRAHIYATQWHPELSFRQSESIEHAFFENFLRACENCRMGL